MILFHEGCHDVAFLHEYGSKAPLKGAFDLLFFELDRPNGLWRDFLIGEWGFEEQWCTLKWLLGTGSERKLWVLWFGSVRYQLHWFATTITQETVKIDNSIKDTLFQLHRASMPLWQIKVVDVRPTLAFTGRHILIFDNISDEAGANPSYIDTAVAIRSWIYYQAYNMNLSSIARAQGILFSRISTCVARDPLNFPAKHTGYVAT